MPDNNHFEEPKKQSLFEKEEEVLKFWKENKIFEKSLKKNPPSKNLSFYDGPPFITGLPHYATLLPSIAKDIIPRYQTMKGNYVPRVWGWDVHGLPIENKVEEQLGFRLLCAKVRRTFLLFALRSDNKLPGSFSARNPSTHSGNLSPLAYLSASRYSSFIGTCWSILPPSCKGTLEKYYTKHIICKHAGQ